jgi:hypothetical protein
MDRLAITSRKLDWMRERHIWPNGLRYLWTDAFGVVLLTTLFRHTGDKHYLDQAEWVVAEVKRVLGRPHGIRIGEAPDRYGQYYHYLAMWLYALYVLGTEIPAYRNEAIILARDIHPAFVIPGAGVIWKMREDLSEPDPEYGGFGALDAFHGYVVYRLLDPVALATEISQMGNLIEANYQHLMITQDLGLGMMLWFTHFSPDENWAKAQRKRSLQTLETLWRDPPGYFIREPYLPDTKFAFTNYGIAVGLQSIGKWLERTRTLLDFFESYRSGDEYDTEAITHVMACAAYVPGGFIDPGPETSR